jgi:23S rRNA (cytosine1962-C5)-methyltransferase
MLELDVKGWKDYELIDSGDFEKLERYGKFILRRPEPQAVWPKRLSDAEWDNIPQAWFRKSRNDNSVDSAERGEWICKKGMPDQWSMEYALNGKNIKFRLGMTSFKHVGIFPEQASNWDFIFDKVSRLNNDTVEPRVLNLFAYTGGATLAAASAGALVTHVDSVKPVVTWARENFEASGLQNARWIVEDAMKYVIREVKRGNKYHGIILDPPAYGRGPEGEKWTLSNQISGLLESCSSLLEEGGFIILNLYSMGFSPIIAANLLSMYFPAYKDAIEYGELMVSDKTGLRLPLSVFARF